jgi:hypothetical protein
MQDACAANNFMGYGWNYTSECDKLISAWGGGTWDSVSGCLIIGPNGGHTDSADNSQFALCSLDTTPTLTRVRDPNPITVDSPSYAAAASPPPGISPSARHSYQNYVVLPQLHKLFLFNGSTYSNANKYYDTWLEDLANLVPPFSPSNLTWVRQNPVNGDDPEPTIGTGDALVESAYDPVTGLVIVEWDGGLFTYNAVTNTYALLKATNTSGCGSTGGQCFLTSAFDPIRRLFIFIGEKFMDATPYVYVISLKAGSTYDVMDWSSLVSGCSGLASNNWPGFTYNPQNGMLEGWPNSGNTVYTFNPDTKTCTSHTYTGGPTNAAPANTSGTFGRWAYSPVLGRIAVVSDVSINAWTYTPPMPIDHSTLTCHDIDGDGYGVGPGCTGPDADDQDVAVHTAAQCTTAHSTFAGCLAAIGYTPTNIYYISTTGNNSTGVVNDITHPYLNCAGIVSSIQPGDAVIFRGGTYTFKCDLNQGTAGNYAIHLAYPGELPVFDGSTAGIATTDKSWLQIDGFKFQNNSCIAGGSSSDFGASSTYAQNIFRHLEATDCQWTFSAFNGLVNMVIEDSVFHDNVSGGNEHCVYLGSRGTPSQNVTFRRNIMYDCDQIGFQFNGKVSNLVLQQNIAYNTLLAGFSFENGVSNSYVQSNVAFNNGRPGLIISEYDGDGVNCNDAGMGGHGRCPYDQTGNLVEDNTFYGPGKDYQGTDASLQPSLEVQLQSGCTTTQCLAADLGHNTFRNNIFVSPGANNTRPPVQFGGTANPFAGTSSFTNNQFYQSDGNAGTSILNIGLTNVVDGTNYTCATAGMVTTSSGCQQGNPLFTAASPTYYATPASYNFRLQSGSPALGVSIINGYSYDALGTPFNATTRSLGALETSGSGGSIIGGKIITTAVIH